MLIQESWSEVVKQINIEQGATVGDLVRGDTCMACEACGELLVLDRRLDMHALDSITVECPCGYERTFNDERDPIPTTRFEEGEHALAWATFNNEWSVLVCTRCGLNAGVMREDVDDDKVPYLELYTLGKARAKKCDQKA